MHIIADPVKVTVSRNKRQAEDIEQAKKKVKLDHCYSKRLSYEKTIQNLNYTLRLKQKKIKTLQANARRKKSQIKSLWDRMESKNLMKPEDDFFCRIDPTLKALLLSHKNCLSKSKSAVRYTDQVKQFAVTMHFHSPKAYRFLRSHIALPHESTLTAWMRNSNCDPGVCRDIIARLGKVRSDDCSNSLTDIVLQLDEMSIRKDTPYDFSEHRFMGHVDYGLGDVADNSPLATNALVCLAVGISGGWKIPVGYIFTNKVDSEIMFNFVNRVLESLAMEKFIVHAIVSDGFSANVQMFSKLGVSESKYHRSEVVPTHQDVNYKFSYKGQVENIHAVYDVVHMLKLLRNMLASYKVIEWVDGSIEWKYIESLQNLQENEGIKAANKLSKNHVHFEMHKMKVKLAAQIFSSSVADAIDFCRDDLELAEFKGSEGTCKFLRMVDGMFDCLNSKNPKQKSFKAPMTTRNFESKSSFLESVMRRLITLKYNNKLIMYGQRKRAIVGLICSIKSILAVSRYLLYRSNSPFCYVLTYRFSQDLLELLFNKIRGKLGCNNNPNVVEFKNIMKRLWHQNSLKSNSTGNCIVRTEEVFVPGALFPLIRKLKRKMPSFDIKDTVPVDYLECSKFYTSCMAYMAGNVVRSIREKLQCSVCFDSLHESPDDRLSPELRLLIDRKNNGGLIYPSNSVYQIIAITDSVIKMFVNKQLSTPPSIKYLDLKISSTVIKALLSRPEIFRSLHDHAVDYDPFNGESHLSSTIKMIIHGYMKIQLYDIGKMSHKTISERHKRSKCILFRNE